MALLLARQAIAAFLAGLCVWATAEAAAQPCQVSLDVPTSHGDNQAMAQPAAREESPAPSFRLFARGLRETFGRSLFAKESAAPLVIAGASAAVLLPFDRRISDRATGSWPPFGRAGQAAGGTVPMLSATVGLAIASFATDSQRFRKLAFAFGQSMALSNLLVEGLKVAVRRERPDGSSRLAFPSLHAADSFTLATVVTRYYGWKWGVPAYGFASLVALSRVEYGKHWPSDVVAGAALGYVCAQAGIRTTERLSGRGPVSSGRASTGLMGRLSIQPYAGFGRVGVLVSVAPR